MIVGFIKPDSQLFLFVFLSQLEYHTTYTTLHTLLSPALSAVTLGGVLS